MKSSFSLEKGIERLNTPPAARGSSSPSPPPPGENGAGMGRKPRIWGRVWGQEVPWGFLFFRKQEVTYLSSSRRVDGFKVSKSISISSGLEFLREGSRDWMMWTTRPSFSPGSLLMSRLSCLFSS